MDKSPKWMYETHKCCCCGKPLSDRAYTGINLMQLEYCATWEYPVMGNVLDGTFGIACAIVCDPCIKSKAEVKWALEYTDKLDREEAIIYHPIAQLKPVEKE